MDDNQVKQSNDQLEQYISETVQKMIDEVVNMDNLLDQDKFNALIDTIKSILDGMGLTLQQVVPQQVLLNYFHGVDQATALLAETGLQVSTAMALSSTGQIAPAFRKKMNKQAVTAIVEDTLMDLNAAIRTAKENATTSIGDALESVKADIAKGTLLGDSNKVISKKVMTSFLKHGLSCFVTAPDKNGIRRSLPLDYYSRTVTRTKLKEASTIGNVNRYRDAGVELVKVVSSYPTCYECANYSGMVVSLVGSKDGFPSKNTIKFPPYHPNCSCNLQPYVEKFKTEEEIQSEKDKWKGFDENHDPRSKNQKKEYTKQQEIRRRANEEKKQFIRFQNVLGAENFKTLGAFRRAKRSNSPKYQELLSEYRSIAQQASTSQ